jgi:Ca2+-binding EF-hand superfamily protein
MRYFNTVDPVEELTNAFKVFDRDGDGVITIDELRTTMKKLGESMPDDELEKIFKDADANGDGVLEISGV